MICMRSTILLFRSTNNGSTWIPVNNGLDINFSGYYIGAAGSTIFSTSSGKLYRSTNNGDTWTKIDNNGFTPNLRSVVKLGNNLFIPTVAGGIYKSTDDGLTWKPSAKGLDSTKPFVDIVAVGTTLFAASYGNGVFKSTDFGNTWVSNIIDGDFLTMSTIALTQTGSTLLALTRGGVFRTTDKGENWYFVPKLYRQSITTLIASESDFFAGSSVNGVFRSSDEGFSWSIIGLPNRNIYTIASKGLITVAGSWNGMISISKDNANTWEGIDLKGLTNEFVQVIAINDTNIFVGTEAHGLFRKGLNSEDWTSTNSDLPNLSVNTIASEGTVLIAGTNKGGIYRSVNSGINWNNINSELSDKNILSLLISQGVLIAGTDTGIYRSTDNGATWSASNYLSKPVLEFASEESSIFARTDTGLVRSTDNGATWLKVNSELSNLQVTSLIIKNKVLFAGILDGGIFYSKDNGENWIPMNQGMSNKKVTCLAINNSVLYAGTQGASVWKYNIYTLSGNDSPNQQSSQPRLLYCYPNPASHTLTIDCTTLQFPENTPVHYTLSTLVGGTVMEFDNSEPKFTVPLDGLASGVYSLSAESGGNRAVVMVTVVE